MKQRLLKLTLLLLLGASSAFAQDRAVTGIVKAKDGSVMPGVNVLLKGTSTGTTTDADGVYKISVPSDQSILVFSFIGSAPQEIIIGSRTSLDVVLAEDVTQLGEVVVTALGIEKDIRTLGYATTELSGSKFTDSREINLGNALTGQIAGVNVSGLGTGPTGSSRVTIRGNSSLTGNNQPLYVIDGVPFDNTNQGSAGQYGGADFGDGLSAINPDNIENIQVLKGAAASALYGYRGGNGAILITTKSGKRSKGVGIEINNNFTLNKIDDQRDYQYEYGQGSQGLKPKTQAAALGASQSSWGAKLDGSEAVNFLGDTIAYSPAKDNFDNFFKTGMTNQASIALTSSGDFGNFRLSVTNLNMTPTIPNSNMKQQGVNFNATINITKKLQASLTTNYVVENVKNRASFSDAPGNVLAGPIYLANSFDIRWLKAATNPDGSEMLPGTNVYFNNPYFIANNFQNRTTRNRLTSSVKLKYDFTNWLSLQGTVSRDGYIFDLTNITPSGTAYNPGGNITQHKTDYHELNGNFMFMINKEIGNFGLDANIGANSQDNVKEKGGVVNAGGFKVPKFYSTNNVASRPFVYEYAHYRVNSIFGSVDLHYKEYLFLTATARKDWFSTLNINSNSYLYPSVSGSFVFSEVFQLPKWISFGKLRLSHGQSSNGTSPYRNLLTYGLEGYTIAGQSLGYINQAQVPNSSLKPVKISDNEVGMNLQFFNRRIEVDAAYYVKNTKDDILGVTISPTTGYTGTVVNFGSLRNKGIELLVNGSPIKTNNFGWDVSFNFASNDSKVLALSEGVNEIVIDGAFPRWGNGVSVKNIVGLPFAQIAGYKYKVDDQGRRVFGANGLPLRSDKVEPLGSGVYKITGGVTNTVRYKNVSLSFLFDYKFGAKIYSGTNLLLYLDGLHQNTLNGREDGVVATGVTEAGEPNTVNVPAQVYYQAISEGTNHVTEEFVYDASFIKLRSLSIGYSVPESLLKKVFIKGATVSFVARNLATLMKHTPNIDPESNLNNTNGQGLELSGYPALRSVGFNVNLKF
jgi:TonB-linked SusC/RagA family outer membrane protein